MSDGKWKFTEQYTQKTSSEKIERGGMILIFCIGMILLAGGLLFSCYPAGSSPCHGIALATPDQTTLYSSLRMASLSFFE